jgi:hypothetical protein
MGQKMMLALLCTIAAPVLFQPALREPAQDCRRRGPLLRVAMFAEEEEDDFEPDGRSRGRTWQASEHEREDEAISDEVRR